MGSKGNGYVLTQSEYASLRGISQPMVAKLIRQGKLDGAYVKKGRFTRINPDKADAILAQFHNPAKSKTIATPAGLDPPDPVPVIAAAKGTITFAEAARREKQAKAALAELKLKRERGELVERRRVKEVAAKIATEVRVGLEAIPAKIAPTVAGLNTPAEVARIMQKEVNTILNNLANGIGSLEL